MADRADSTYIIPVFTTRDYNFIADMIVDIAYAFDIVNDHPIGGGTSELTELLDLVCDKLKPTNNSFKDGVFRDRVVASLNKRYA